ncbi:ABC transporter ATP-binding protein [Croceicoccus naphthovorans]|uniref:Uncharacterized protein n=1 Tax=Croceicoccus naphthovorans TaxID=1348774 RepID=A0A0G3XE84_9SPHN|nr:ABC transporter ATP-binding protein [Croceicoccus naphthovorans]AKM08951.1 hypothetical protein AB433_01520 [Croceicoccus naphthovorans]MBB3989260.1 ATP-binding cassette subfamily C protein [Croceicoccus naphthovorans]
MNEALTVLKRLPASRTAQLLALMLGVALTEGIGIVALVPLLSLHDPGASSALPQWVDPLRGLLSLPLILCLFVVLVAGRSALQYAMGLSQTRLQHELVDGWRKHIVTTLVHADWRTLSAMRQSDNVSLIVSSLDRVGFGFGQLLLALAAGMTLGAIWIAAFLLSPLISLVAIGGGVVVVLTFRSLKRRARGIGEAVNARYRDVHAALEASLRALRLIKSHGREAHAVATMEGGIGALRETELDFRRASGRSRAFLQTGAAVLLAIIVGVAWARDVAPAILLPLVVLFARSVPLLDTIQQAMQNWSHAAPALNDAQDLIAKLAPAQEAAVESPGRMVPASEIAVRGATLRHPGRERPALCDVGLSLAVGRTTVLVGPSGAGKSTLADIFGGLVDADEGALFIDGARVEGEDRTRWRHSVAYVHQEPVLFHATIRENLIWAEPDADAAQMVRTLREAAADFVFDLPQGIDTIVGDAGRQLSGGERQRIALARALLRDPALLILDEATSALDSASEAAIASAIADMAGQRTILVIAHRGVLTDLADTVVTLADGRVERVENCERARA